MCIRDSSPGAPHALFPLPGQRYKECDIVFHPRLLYGAADGVLWRHVRVYLAEAAAGIALPDPESAAHIASACALCAQKPPLYEFRVREALTRVFCQACAALREPRSVRVDVYKRQLLHLAVELEAQGEGHILLFQRCLQCLCRLPVAVDPRLGDGQVNAAQAAVRDDVAEMCIRDRL